MVTSRASIQPGASTASEQLFERATRLMPGGVNSPVRAFKAVGGSPRFIASASGCTLIDADGNQLIDYIGAYGPMIAGHAHPAVLEAMEHAARDGLAFGAPTRAEIDLAEEIIARVSSVEMVRMVNSGTEAVMSVLRLARAATGRARIVKFEGCYHGHADALLTKAGSGVATLGLPDSPGVTPDATRDTIVLPFADEAVLRAAFARHPDSIAAILVEPIPGNMGVVPPPPGYLAFLRTLTRDHGALLIFDEVMTGFRVARAGAQQLTGVTPDLTTFAKVIGGGMPVGAYAGPARLMNQIAPAGPVYQAGTLSGNPVAMAAGLATLRLLGDDAYAHLERVSSRLEEGLRAALTAYGIPFTLNRVGSMLTLFFAVDRVRNFADARAADHKGFAQFFQGMLRRGVHLPPSGYEAWFLSLAHDDDAIDRTLDAARDTLDEIAPHVLKAAGPERNRP